MQLLKLPIIVVALIMSCSTNNSLEGFDDQSWKNDPMGCNSIRIAQIDDLMERKSELQGLGQTEITDALGSPDRHELYARNKKAFVYYLDRGPECEVTKENPPRLVVRFDGIGRAKDIIYYNQ